MGWQRNALGAPRRSEARSVSTTKARFQTTRAAKSATATQQTKALRNGLFENMLHLRLKARTCELCVYGCLFDRHVPGEQFLSFINFDTCHTIRFQNLFLSSNVATALMVTHARSRPRYRLGLLMLPVSYVSKHQHTGNIRLKKFHMNVNLTRNKVSFLMHNR